MVNDATGSMRLTQGWDSVATLVGDRWIERRPRRPGVAERLRMETRLMPWLAPRLPLRVPEPRIARAEPLTVRHVLVPGGPSADIGAAQGRELGVFLRALHAVAVADAVAHGLPAASATVRDRVRMVDRFRTAVLPRVPAVRRGAADALLDAVGRVPADTAVHGDLGPEHVLSCDGRLTGVIDFSNAHVGDVAIDLAWGLYAAPRRFADAFAEEYGLTPELRERALLWYRLGPWHEVLHGLDHGLTAEVHSGMDGLLRRLPR